MTAKNIFGPFGPGINESTQRPAAGSSGTDTDSWFSPCVNGDPNTGTKISYRWLNFITANLRRAVRGMGVTEDDTDDDMLLKAIQSAMAADVVFAAVDTGTANAHVLGRSGSLPMATAYVDGMVLLYKPAHTNTSATTANAFGLGVRSVVDWHGAALVGGEFVADRPTALRYSSASDKLVLLPWASALFGVVPPAPSPKIIQRAYVEMGTQLSVNNSMWPDPTGPTDAPKITNGTQVMSGALPSNLSSASNRVRIRIVGCFCHNYTPGSSMYGLAALFDGATDAIHVQGLINAGGIDANQFALQYEYAPGTVLPKTYSLRIGAIALSATPNGYTLNAGWSPGGGADNYAGGKMAWTMIIEEIAP